MLATETLTSWGRVQRVPHLTARPRWPDELPAAIAEAATAGEGGLAVGLMRSYGDSCLNPGGAAIDMRRLDRVHAFDPASGVLRADAGLSLDALIRLVLPHGWFPAAVPGTAFVTLGGAVANDVHGKNHHLAGTFGRHVRRLGLRRTDGGFHELAPPDALFGATLGGLGLTGVVEWVELQLAPVAGAWLENEDVPFGGLADFFALARESEATHAYTVAWVDCTATGRRLGRGIFSRAVPLADPDRTPHRPPRLRVPVEAPAFTLNRLSVSAFNTARYALKSARRGRRRTHYGAVHFPLDGIEGWNRMYGRPGFYQYQCVVPPETAEAAVAELLRQIAQSGEGSFLAVLKTFGGLESPGWLSFPMAGTTLALDFRNRGAETLKLFERFDSIVAEAGGRLYPAKDGRVGAEMFARGYPRLGEFAAHVDPGLSSSFWRRIRP